MKRKSEQLKLACVLAHPDDESMGTGGILAKYAAQGIDTYLITATRGERGWFGDEADYPGPERLGQIRQQELRQAAKVLGLQDVTFLDYVDGQLDQANPDEVIGKIVTCLRQIRPHVVVTFDPNGAYGHPDHIAICQFTTAAVVAAADPTYANGHRQPPHRVSKLYYLVATQQELEAYEAAFGKLAMQIDGVERQATGWKPWAITTRINTSGCRQQVWQAICCHKTQLPGYQALQNLPDTHRQTLWGTESYYRAFSLVNGGRSTEDDLFAGLR